MKTKLQIIADLKREYPILKTGNDDQGYTELNSLDYEATIDAWAENELASAAIALEKAQAEAAKLAAQAKLEALGLTTDDLKALGL
jgi:hypothetical protein